MSGVPGPPAGGALAGAAAGGDGSPRAEAIALEVRLTGLAAWHLRREELDEAERCLDLAERLRPGGFRQRLTRARLLVLQGEDLAAMAELLDARAADPWDEDVSDLLARLRQARGELAESLVDFGDASVAAGSLDPERAEGYAESAAEVIAELAQGGVADLPDFGALVSERLEHLLALGREAIAGAEALAAAGASVAGEDAASSAEAAQVGEPAAEPAERLSAAELLHGAGLFPGLEPPDLELLEGAVQRALVAAGQPVFREGLPSEDIYVVETGRVAIQRDTPFGIQGLATVGPGSVFGEMNFIDGRPRSADAIALEDSRLLRISHAALGEVFEAEPTLALAFLREFWRGLADKVREANDLMKSFFDQQASPVAGEEAEAAPAPAEPEDQDEGLAVDEKAKVLSVQGLTGEDLQRLAEFAEVRGCEVEKAIFREGDPGTALFIVAAGQVRISKEIPGVGEEALAILERGDFFGEMALIDGLPRSASAKAHATETKVLRISKEKLEELLERGGGPAIELLSILCRLLSTRLREINDRIVQWKMMSGGF